MSIITSKIRGLFLKCGVVATGDLVDEGMTRSALSRLVSAGELMRVARGLYALPEYQLTEHGVLALVKKRVPGALFCLLTALRFHELTTQSPFEVWIAIGNKAHAPKLGYPRLRVVRFSQIALTMGVDRHRLEGTQILVTSPAKTVADCFKFRNKVGLDVALEALREARRSGCASADDLWRFAEVNRVTNVMRPYLEAVDNLPLPRLLAYSREAQMAEKLEAIVHLGMTNSRMKDYYDLLALVEEGRVEVPKLGRALAATFAGRGTVIPSSLPLGLSNSFSSDATRLAQWKGFLNRNKLDAPDLDEVVSRIHGFVAEPFRLAREASESG